MKAKLNWNAMSRSQRIIITSMGVLVGIFASIILTSATGGLAPSPVSIVSSSSNVRTITDTHLNWADEASRQVAEQELRPLVAFFEEARQNTRRFAQETLSFDSKLTLVSDFFTQNGDHPRFLKERFESMVFVQDDLDRAVRGVVANYLRRLDHVEAQMLVRMKADLATLPETSMTGDLAPGLSKRLESVIREAVTATQTELQATVGLEIVSYLAGEVVTQATLQLATSSGILGAGALSGTTTFGVSLVVGLIVDQIVTEIYNEAVDPVGKLSGTLNERLTEMERLILDGTTDKPGLVKALAEIAARRSVARRQAIHGALPVAF
jgi:hypothetical protein